MDEEEDLSLQKGAWGRIQKTRAQLTKAEEGKEGSPVWALRWKLVVVITDLILGIFPDAVLGVAGVACAVAGSIYLGQKWKWALNAVQAAKVGDPPKKSDMHWFVVYCMYALVTVAVLEVLYMIFLLPDSERPDRLAKKFQVAGGGARRGASTLPTYALLIIGASIVGVFSSILSESTLRKDDPEAFRSAETLVPDTNRRLLFLHGVVGLAVAFAVLLVI